MIDPPATTPHDRPTWVRWRIVLILMCFTGLNHFHRQSLPAVVNDVMRDCGFDEVQMGSIYSAFLLGYVIFMVPGGWFSDQFGGRLALVISGFGTAALVAVTGACGLGLTMIAGLVVFQAVRFCMGALTAPLFPAAGRIVNAWIPFASRGWANGIVLGATTVGVSLAPIVFGALRDVVGWRAACGMMGLVTAAVSCVWLCYGRNRPAEHPGVNAAELAILGEVDVPAEGARTGGVSIDDDDVFRLLANPSLWLLTTIYAAMGYYEYTLFYWMKYYFSDVRGYSEETSRYFTFVVTSAMVFAMPLGGILSDRLVQIWSHRAGRACVPVFGMIASAILLFLATRAVETVEVVALFFLAHAAMGLCETPSWVAALELGGRNCATSAAVVNTGGNFGGMLAPVCTAFIAKHYGWNAGFLVASGACLVGVLLWSGIRLKSPEVKGSEWA